MIIEKIEIESFAALKNLTLELSDGLNLIEGSNESGKSSIADFIKFVLYGVSGKASDGHISERKRAISFTDSHAGGALCVKIGERHLRITRNTAVSGTVRETARTKFSVRDMETGADISDGREPGEQLLGIPESVFVRSAYLSQGGASELDGADVHSAISNILFSGDERLSVEKAVERIENARIPLMHKHGSKGRIYELRAEIEKLSEQLIHSSEANEKILTLASSTEEKKKTYTEQTARYEQYKKAKRAYECAKALESFEKIKDAEKEKVSAEMAMLEFIGSVHIPTDAEMDELRTYEINVSKLLSSLSESQALQNRLEKESAGLNISSKLKAAVEKEGSADDLLTNAERAGASASRLTLFSLLSASVGAICGVGAFALRSLALPLGCTAAVFGVIFTVLLILSLCKKKQLRSILYDTDTGSVTELEEALQAYESAKLRLKLLEEKISENLKLHQKNKALVASELGRLGEFLLDIDIEDKVEGMASFSKITQALKERQKKHAELEAAASTTRAFYEGLISKTESLDAQKLKDELDSLGVSDPLGCDIEKTEKSMQFLREQAALLSGKIHEQEIMLAELRAKLTSPSAIRERICECTDELERCERKLDSYVLAADSLRVAAEELRRGIAPALAKQAGEYMSILTDGKYTSLSLDSSFALSYEAAGDIRHIDYMSAGTQDMAYLCLRLSLSDIISKEGSIPIILDEATAHLDDTRAKSLLSLLAKRSDNNIQHLLFTCHGREAVLLSGADVSFNYIKL